MLAEAPDGSIPIWDPEPLELQNLNLKGQEAHTPQAAGIDGEQDTLPSSPWSPTHALHKTT